MAFSIQTNVNSLVAQENLRVNSNFQSQTIQRLTSGYRINSSADDAAGLAVANKFRSDVSELSQGVRNANDGVSQLQIADSGMANVSKMLDRLRTLATQSASSTFTGDRNVLNGEFQSLLTEIDRQAQSIGLNQNGAFAKSLSVFIGGGRASSSSALDTTNGTVTVDLRNSTVDTTSLGLKGTQVKAGVSDVAAAIGLANNRSSIANNLSHFYFSGAGFSTAQKIDVAVDTTGVTNTEELATAINAAITTAAGGNTTQAAAFKAAGIVAGVYTDTTTNDKSLTFTSASSAFQVEAGDKMANALLGNFETGVEGLDMTAKVAGAVAVTDGGVIATPTSVKVRITGGGLGADGVTLTVSGGKTQGSTAAQDIEDQVAAHAALKAAGITADYTSGQALKFSNSHGEHFNVSITGDTNDALGFGAWQAGGVPAADYTSYSGSAYTAASQYSTATLYFSINGGANTGAEQVNVDLTLGDATKTTVTGTGVVNTAAATPGNFTFQVTGGAVKTVTVAQNDTIEAIAGKINGQAGGVTATVNSSGKLILTADNAGGRTITLTEGTGGLAASGLGSVTTSAGRARTGSNLADALNTALNTQPKLAEAGLQATWDTGAGAIVITSSNDTNFRVNASGANADIGFGSTGAAWGGTSLTGSDYNVNADAQGTSHLKTSLTYNDMNLGSDTQSLTISANDSTGALQSKTITLANAGTTRTGRTIDEAITEINSQLQASQNATLQKIVAVKESGTTEKINFVSSLTGFSVAIGASANGNGFSAGGATGTTVSSEANGTGGTAAIDTAAKASQAVTSVASALATLGIAQAAVGKGQNQLNYAIGLAQSQISNFSSAESRIRDADVASEAANLTKAQVLQQASIAAMAQANSAPQAVLSLLRG